MYLQYVCRQPGSYHNRFIHIILYCYNNILHNFIYYISGECQEIICSSVYVWKQLNSLLYIIVDILNIFRLLLLYRISVSSLFIPSCKQDV